MTEFIKLYWAEDKEGKNKIVEEKRRNMGAQISYS